ncbi:hypothetical protein [Neisseria zalophi]|nr:hypothetical protein [Neisseria zalophi]
MINIYVQTAFVTDMPILCKVMNERDTVKKTLSVIGNDFDMIALSLGRLKT